MGRRGIPRLIVPDNAKTFEKAERELTVIFDSPLIQDYLSGRRIDWQYNLAKAPWWGGFFERLIKEVKLCLKKVLGRTRLTFDELSTILVEIEAVLNSRPLTYLYLDEIEELLTPFHLVIGRRLLTLPSRSEDEETESSSAFTRRAAYLATKLQHFWKRWQRKYLVQLREFHRVRNKKINLPVVGVGDLVVVRDEKTSQRGFWKMGRVEALIKGNDGLVRGARVVVSRKGRRQTLEGPLQHLYPLEVCCQTADPPPVLQSNQQNAVVQVPNQQRPRRAAAVRATRRIREFIVQLGAD